MAHTEGQTQEQERKMVKHTTIPFAPFTPPGATPSLARLAYDRLGFGPRPGATDFNDVTSLNAYIDAQLAPEVIDDSACDAYIAGMSRLDSAGFTMPVPDATTAQIRQYVAATTAYGPGELGEFLRKATTARAIFSKRQLLEAMVDFWNNHLNTTINTSQYKYWEDRYVMREFALGNFRDILGASAKSPSMLAFLSNRYSDGSNPNENYARELLELHSMSPTNHIPGDPQNGQANYTEVDVHTLAQILSGWTNTHSEEDEFEFNDSPYWPSHHYPPKKLYLGGNTPIYFPYGGQEQGEYALDVISAHKSTAYFISWKLCQRFISDVPDTFCPNVVAAGMNAFIANYGNIRETLRVILKADFPGADFKSSWGQKIKRPFEFLASALRAMNASSYPPPNNPYSGINDWDLLNYYNALGQELFAFPTPDGFPEEMTAWMNTNHVFGRWTLGNLLVRRYFGEISNNWSMGATAPANAALDVFVGASPGPALNATQVVDRLIGYFIGRTIDTADRVNLITYLSNASAGNPNAITSTNLNIRPLIGALIASPYFQWR